MFSLKDAVRKTILTVSLAAVTTSFFVGCNNNQPVSSNDLYPPTIEATITAEAPPSLTDDIDPTTPDANNFSIKFKYWYDNPDVQEAQSQIPNPGGDDNGETFLDLAGLPIYTDPDGNQYIISGRTPVYLKDGKIASKDLYNLLRNEGTGERLYYGVADSMDDLISEFRSRLEAIGARQILTYDERVAGDTSPELKETTYEIFVNNMSTGYTTSPENMVEVSSVLPVFGLAAYESGEDNYSSTIYVHAAGASNLKIDVIWHSDCVDFEYSTGESEKNIGFDEVQVTTSTLKMTPDAMERYLGFDVEVYDNFINIVTDVKDIATENSLIPGEASSLADPSLNDLDTTTPIEPQLPETEESADPKPEDTKTEDTKPEDTKPATKNPDDKIPGSDLTYGEFEEIYGYEVPDNAINITEKRYDLVDELGNLASTILSPEEAKRRDEEDHAIMSGEKPVDLTDGDEQHAADILEKYGFI